MTWNPLRARRTRARCRLAAVLLALPDDRHYGWPLCRVAGLPAGSIYPDLTRMLVQGWLTDGWDDDPSIPEDRRRRYYMVTEVGRRELAAILRAAGTS